MPISTNKVITKNDITHFEAIDCKRKDCFNK